MNERKPQDFNVMTNDSQIYILAFSVELNLFNNLEITIFDRSCLYLFIAFYYCLI